MMKKTYCSIFTHSAIVHLCMPTYCHRSNFPDQICTSHTQSQLSHINLGKFASKPESKNILLVSLLIIRCYYLLATLPGFLPISCEFPPFLLLFFFFSCLIVFVFIILVTHQHILIVSFDQLSILAILVSNRCFSRTNVFFSFISSSTSVLSTVFYLSTELSRQGQKQLK